jgi:starch synthase (maltosyl-transferring)
MVHTGDAIASTRHLGGTEIDGGADDGLSPARVVIDDVEPSVDGGRFAVKAIDGDALAISANVFADGHDAVAASVWLRRPNDDEWREVEMTALGNDRYRALVRFEGLGRHEFVITGWIDHYASWLDGSLRKQAANVLRQVDLDVGAALIDEARRVAASRGEQEAAQRVAACLEAVRTGDLDAAATPEVVAAMRRFAPRGHQAKQVQPQPVQVGRARARFGAWYELFPRSWSGSPGAHGTFRDVERWLPYVADMGFDVVYLPPIHPIGTTHRKGPNNATASSSGDVGSPWAIGADAGGHTAVHPDLGTIADFHAMREAVERAGLEVALDLAFQCSPDHPWVREHPEWFHHLPDGSIQPAENPPKRYEDVYPLDFDTPAWRELWDALEGVVRFWIDQGVCIFRVDNPHTKPLAFWEWLIERVHADRPDVLFLAEAFTRPALMYRLAKLGFDQSYTYFTWRQSAAELREYLTELTSPRVAAFFRPNAWPNTPDILTEQLQWGGRPVFVSRLVLAATLFANYGIYGPAFELLESTPRDGVEEYVDNEKYQLRHWHLDHPNSLRPVITVLNRVRHEHRALQRNSTLRFHDTDNPQLLCYSKTVPTNDARAATGDDPILVVVNVDPHHRHAGFVDLDLDALGVAHDTPFLVHDLLGGGRFRWQGGRNYVELDPHISPAHVFAIRRHVRTESDFDYFR